MAKESNASKQLRDLTKRLGAMPAIIDAIAADWGTIALRLARQQALTRRQPTGRPWKPRKKDGKPALGAFAGSLSKKDAKATFTIKSTHVAAKAHNFGAKKVFSGPIPEVDGKKTQKREVLWRLPVRRVLPKKQMPKEWAVEMVKAAEQRMSKALR